MLKNFDLDCNSLDLDLQVFFILRTNFLLHAEILAHHQSL